MLFTPAMLVSAQVEYLLEYSAAAVLMILGFWTMFASIIVAHRGAHGNPNPLLGMAAAVAGLGICLGAYCLVRNLPREKIFRNVFNMLLLLESLSLVGVGANFGYGRLFPGGAPEIPVEYENARFVYGFTVCGLCLATLWFLNFRLRPQKQP